MRVRVHELSLVPIVNKDVVELIVRALEDVLEDRPWRDGSTVERFYKSLEKSENSGVLVTGGLWEVRTVPTKIFCTRVAGIESRPLGTFGLVVTWTSNVTKRTNIFSLYCAHDARGSIAQLELDVMEHEGSGIHRKVPIIRETRPGAELGARSTRVGAWSVPRCFG